MEKNGKFKVIDCDTHKVLVSGLDWENACHAARLYCFLDNSLDCNIRQDDCENL